jgi:hypothetical protein
MGNTAGHHSCGSILASCSRVNIIMLFALALLLADNV